jgi:hypothetical protein
MDTNVKRGMGSLALGMTALLGVAYFIWPAQTAVVVEVVERVIEAEDVDDAADDAADDFWLNVEEDAFVPKAERPTAREVLRRKLEDLGR